ncbi:MAG: SIMPL domain-containing protein [Sedimenticola sp.]|nr:SIMPL domain-containing protein [Sedimenticola sp.]
MSKLLVTLALCLSALQVFADGADATYDRISLSVAAGEEVTNDRIEATLFLQQEGNDPAQLAQRINRAISQALEKARDYPEVESRSLDYSTHPVYRNSSIVAWRVRQSIGLKSADSGAVSRLIGELQQTLSVAEIGYTISPERQRQVEAGLTAEAIARFRERAELIQRKMGYAGYRLVNMNIGSAGGGPRPPYPMRAMSLKAESAPALEAGSQRIEVQISGTIELQRQ